jgi:peptidoglycan/LPS O-acetylase OafA/YrhL
MPVAEYLSDAATLNYLNNATLWRIQFTLPGVFEANAYPSSVNGSLWTLPAEVRCYVLAGFALFLGLTSTKLRTNVVLFGVLVVAHLDYRSIPFFGLSPTYGPLGAHFVVGALLWTNRQWIPRSRALATLSLLILLGGIALSIPAALSTLAWTYLVLFIAESRFAERVQEAGDPSYGVYLYAFPVQQAMWSPGQSPWMNIALSAPTTVLLGYASWWLVERKASAATMWLAAKMAFLSKSAIQLVRKRAIMKWSDTP